MSKEKSKSAKGAPKRPAAPPARVDTTPSPIEPSVPERKPPFFRRCDWISFGITTFLVLVGYILTLAPDLTLEDSGELAVGSYYAGVPHPPGYPVWTLYTWLFTVLVPFSNIAWRVALSSAVAAAFSSGLLALIASRGSSMILESVDQFKNIERKSENLICIVAGWVAGMLLGFNGFMWSQAVIVEVYTLSVLSLVATLVLLLRWLYEPERVRWLLWAFFLFGICFTNHQTLICAAMGIEVLICFGRPRLGRDLLLGNVIAYLAGMFLKATGLVDLFAGNTPILVIFHVVGFSSLVAYVWLIVYTKKNPLDLARDISGYVLMGLVLLIPAMLAGFVTVNGGRVFLFSVAFLAVAYGTWWLFKNTWKTVWDFFSPLLCGVAFLLGASFYIYMPLASMTNPPMNWGYPRSVEGFIHAFTRGQYEKTNPTESIGKFFDQIWMLFDGLVSEFNLVFLLIAFLPLAFIGLMKARERAWLIGQVAIYICLSFLLIYLLNPNADKQSTDLTRVFFTASHVMVAMCVGYGVALIGSMLIVDYQRFRAPIMIGGAVAAAVALYGVAMVLMTTAFPLDQFRAYFGLVMTVATTLLVLYFRKKVPLTAFLALAAIAPLYSVMSHWSDNERRGHLFGYWFGHDMFTPPFTDADGNLSYDPDQRERLLNQPESAKLVYPEMARNAILFGGTDPGRFCPTYMIFCESFIKPEQRRDPNFDRRDVYIITQNALADHTYLSYIRAHYNRSTQIDPPFFEDLLRPTEERVLNVKTNWLARTFGTPLDHLFVGIGEGIEARRREDGVYPPEEIYTPTPIDSKVSFETYLQDAGQRKKLNQLKPGEQVDILRDGNGTERIQVAGQVSVMAINALLCKVIFDQNPTNEFYIEESFPLDWMFPHLTPFGIIMKINREPVGTFSEEIYQRDRHFWREYSDRLIGNWINEDTTVDEICDFVEEVFILRDYTNFKGDRKFIRNDQAQKSFSKLRGGIAGLYNFKAGEAAPGSPEQLRAIREAEFAYKQSFAFCPYSPEAAFKYSSMLVNMPGRLPDALRIAETALSMDPNNEQFQYLVDTLRDYQANESGLPKAQAQFNALVSNFQTNPMEITNIQPIIAAFMQMQQTNEALNVIKQVLGLPSLNADMAVQMAIFAQDLQDAEVMELALTRLTQVNPTSPEAWYDLSALQASLQKTNDSISNLKKAIEFSDKRLSENPQSKDLRVSILAEPRFASLRARSDWDEIFGQKPAAP